MEKYVIDVNTCRKYGSSYTQGYKSRYRVRSPPSLKGEMFQRAGTTVEKAHLLVAADRTHSMPNVLDQIGW